MKNYSREITYGQYTRLEFARMGYNVRFSWRVIRFAVDLLGTFELLKLLVTWLFNNL